MAGNVEQCRAALQECPGLMSLEHLGHSLLYRFLQRGVLSDIVEAIDLHRATLAFRPPGHPHRFVSLNNLAVSFTARFQQQAILSDLDEAIELHRAVLAILPPDHFHRSLSLESLANGLKGRFKRRGVLSDIDEAIDIHRASLALRPPGHSDRFMSLNNLASSLQDRFQKRGVLSDLDEAIELHRAVLALCSLDYFARPTFLNNLASCIEDRFERLGILSDLDEAIKIHEVALGLCLPGHSLRPTILNGLGGSLLHRFQQQGVQSDLDMAVEYHRTALTLCPPGHSDRLASHNNLSATLQARFQQQGVLSDIDEAIELLRSALVLRPPDRSTYLNNLSNSLQARFRHRGVLSDLDEAIEFQRGALALCPAGNPRRSLYLDNLAISLLYRIQESAILSNPDEVIEPHRAALAPRPPYHSDRSLSSDNLTINLQGRFQQQGQSPDLDEAFRLYSQLSQVSHIFSLRDISAAKSWVSFAEQVKHGSALVAYQTALKFLDQKTTASLAMDAFSCCVRHGALTTAVELVEQGRAVWWTQLARFRTPLNDLSASGDAGEALAKEFKQLSVRLRNVFDVSTGDRSPQIRQLTMQWDDVVSRIRLLPDFSRFLLSPLFPDLQKGAQDGPVIIVNGSKYSCDALIILSARDPIPILLDITLAEVSELSSEFQSLTEDVGSSDHRLEVPKIVGILRKLWDRVVSPIVQTLRELIHTGSRIWWCPTAEFTLLPLHAAGPYEKKRHNLSHFYVSSYTPTLAALIRARQHVSRDVSVQHFVAVGQGNPEGGKELRCVAAELAVVAERVAPILSFTSLVDNDATIQGASHEFSRNQWLHLACHGIPNRKQPFESSFAMRDGPFTIRNIIRSRLQNPEFAFLSACHTTVGDESSHDEAIHLAAAMQFSGFRSVIGSMWSVDDEAARQVVTAFYDNLVDGLDRLDCRRAAVALHNAVKTLRKKIPLEQQIVFVHIGV
ncbi:CHAT domain-containing protein [Suillus paluster]|uniref:CHAT domain-containing protein n=1 Tax=Suillus paluster TaxID=48578 RepID=UPI001B88351A|nr:CHAT domain-containing protein [Suillus paluster]KAG1734262.1 CHAT domain-containing protein [Suillus paluster]